MKSKILAFIGCLFMISLSFSNTNEMDFNDKLNSIESLDFPTSDYFKVVTEKNQVCLHHTASGKGVSGDYNQFLKPGHIATPIIVGHDKVYQLYSSRYWGYHLGVKSKVFKDRGIDYKRLDTNCIGLEIDNWGPLKLINGEFRAWPNEFGTGKSKDRSGNTLKVVVNADTVVHYPNGFRGYEYYEQYTEFQIDSTKWLLEYWGDHYGIPLHYNSDMWDVSDNALKGESGIYTHVSYRPDKSDCHPQPELIKMLKNLKC